MRTKHSIPLDQEGTTHEFYDGCQEMIDRVVELKALGFTSLKAYTQAANGKVPFSGFCLFKALPTGERCVNLEFEGADEPGFQPSSIPDWDALVTALPNLVG